MRHTASTRAKLSEMRRGERNPMHGRKHTPEARAKIAAGSRATNARRVYVPSPQSVRIPEGVALGYLAGIVDGEGSIRFRKGRPFVAVYNTDKGIMDWIFQNVGGPRPRPSDTRGREICWTWSISAARDVYAVCTALLPYLVAKRVDALAALLHLRSKYGGEVMAGG